MGMTSDTISAGLHQLQEFRVIPNVTGGIVTLGSQNQKHAILGIVVLRRPDHRGNVDTERGCVEDDFLAIVSVVGHHVAAAMNANQKLMQGAMRVFAADLLTRNAEYQE